MNTLLDAIRQNQTKAPAPAPVAGAQVSNILQTKATGKVVGEATGTPAASNIQEQQAQQTGQTAERAVVQQGQNAMAQMGAQAASQAETANLAEKAQDEQAEDARSRLLAQTNEVLSEYQQGARTLDANKDKARLEQVGFGLRLTNEKYMADLHRNAQKDRLNNKAAFQEALTRSIFADEEDLFRDDMSFRAILRADERGFQRAMADLDIRQAIKLAEAESSAANQQAMYGAVGTLASAAAQGGAAYAKQNPTAGE